MGVVSFFMPWFDGYTAIDIVSGNPSFIAGDYHRFLLMAVIVLTVIGGVFSVRSVIDRMKGLSSYGWLLFGFIMLALVVIIGMWAPEGEKINLLGGMGLYLDYVCASLFIGYGLIEYSTRYQK